MNGDVSDSRRVGQQVSTRIQRELLIRRDDRRARTISVTPCAGRSLRLHSGRPTGYDFQLIQMDEAGQTPSACYEKALVKATTVEWCQERLKPLSLDAVDEMTVTPDWQPLSITDTTCS